MELEEDVGTKEMSATFQSGDVASSSTTQSDNFIVKKVFSGGGSVSVSDCGQGSGGIAQGQYAQFSIPGFDRKNKGLTSIIENLKVKRHQKDKSEEFWITGDTTTVSEPLENGTATPTAKNVRKRRIDRSTPTSNGAITTNASVPTSDYSLNNNNNNNHVKNERLSPGTPDTSSRSRSVTPSSASHPDTPPAMENPMVPRNYSDFMRSLAAKYNNSNPNDYFSAARNGFPPPLDPRFKPTTYPNLLPTLPATPNKDDTTKKSSDFTSLLNPFANSPMFPPFIDMSSSQTLLALVRTAKEVELQGLQKIAKRADVPMDLSAAAPPLKRPRIKTPSAGSPGATATPKRAESESPRLHEDVSSWTVDDVCNFVSSIDICAEYVQNFRDQLIDGSGLPLLTEEHLTSTMNMKLGPALKLRSILAKKLGSCNICLHCSHCHNNTNSPENGSTAGNASDSGGTS